MKLSIFSGLPINSNGYPLPATSPAFAHPATALRFLDKDRLGREACKLVAIVKLRDQMTRWLRGGKFLPPTKVGDHATAGFKLGRKAWLVEGEDFLAAYHELHRRVIG